MENKQQGLNGVERAFIIGTNIWIFLQISRLIALILIGDINENLASEAWRYPAYLDLFAAGLAPLLIWAVWRHRTILTWAALIVYWAISIVDHVGNFVTTTFVAAPTIAQGTNPYLVPVIQTVFDVIFVTLLFVPRLRNLFFRIQK